MTTAVHELKIRAEILHKRIKENNDSAVARLRVLPEFRRSSATALAAEAKNIRRRNCLTVIAAEMGFSNWPHAVGVLTGRNHTAGFGALLCPPRCCGHINRWYKTYQAAADMRRACQGYLLAYRRQFLVVDRHYIESLGLDPGDRDWKAIGFDWVRPKDLAARGRLYRKLVAALPRERT